MDNEHHLEQIEAQYEDFVRWYAKETNGDNARDIEVDAEIKNMAWAGYVEGMRRARELWSKKT